MKRLSLYLLPIILCFIIGWLSMIIQSDALIEWYPQLDKPSITPPNSLFPIAWGIIYICMDSRSADSLILVSEGLLDSGF
jgi:tryptophan-rich sensory protein